MCKKGPELEMLGCTFGALIFVRKGLSGRTERLVVRHEKGHVNGWKHQ